jgi:hypothetical protein
MKRAKISSIYVDRLLGKDRGIGDGTAAAARQRPENIRGMVFSALTAKQQLKGSRGKLLPVRSVP